MMNKAPLLAIRCLTYNHEPYIRQCLEGFIIQKTSFPFIAIVHDDASTDKTAEIIEEYALKYPDIIKPILEKENQYSKHDGSLGRILNNAIPESVKYIAMCEGDDYWIDPNKLQKQVDFLESNPEFGMVYGKVHTWLQEENKFGKSFGKKAHTFEELVRYNTIPTLTVVLKYNLQQQYLDEIDPVTKNWKMGDYPMWLYISKVSKIGFIDEYLGVYRINKVSASHFEDRIGHLTFQMNALEIAAYMCNKFCTDTRLTNIRLLWCKLEYAYLISDVIMLREIQQEIANTNLWPISLRIVLLKFFYRHPSVYLKSKNYIKSILHLH